MIKYNIVSIFLSNKNFELSFKLQKWCKELRINLVNVIDLLDLSLKIAQLKPAILLVDENYAKENSDVLSMLIKCDGFKTIKIAYIGEDVESNLVGNDSQNVNFVHIDKVKDFLIKFVNTYQMDNIRFDNSEDASFTYCEKVGEGLISLGLSPKHIGFQYLKGIISYLINKGNGEMLNDCYAVISAKYYTTTANIERSVRNAILRAWQTFGSENWKSLLSLPDKNKKPTNREFIYYVIEMLFGNPNRAHASGF